MLDGLTQRSISVDNTYMNRTTMLFFILFTIVLIIVFIVMAVLFFLNKDTKQTQQTTTPTPITVDATSSPSITLGKPLTLVSIEPGEDTTKEYLPVQQVFFTFSDVIDPAKFFFKVDPEVITAVTYKDGDDNTIIIGPESVWKTGITTITILPTTASFTNSLLTKPVTYRLRTNFPQNPPPDQSHGL